MTAPTKPPQSEILPRIGAGCLLVLGLFMCISALALVSESGTSVGGLAMMSLIGLGFGAAGAYWWRFVTGSEVRRRREFQDKSVLGVASRHGGSTNLAQIALETELSTEDARTTIERLCVRGLAAPEVRDDGSIEYRFGGLLDK